MSAVGAVKTRSLRALQQEADVRALRLAVGDARGASPESGAARSSIVPVGDMNRLETQMQLYGDDDPMSQLALLHKVSMAEAMDRRNAEEAAMATSRDHVQAHSVDLCGVDFEALSNDFASVRTVKSVLMLDVYIH